MICTAQFRKQTAILWSIIALLLIPAFSEARVISVQMNRPHDRVRRLLVAGCRTVREDYGRSLRRG